VAKAKAPKVVRCFDFPIGSRVRFFAPGTDFGGGLVSKDREVTGTVVKHYDHRQEVCENEETGERWVSQDHIVIQVDAIPTWWPYPDTDRFAPEVTECELLKGK
jgi:hypothetical protein